MQVELQPCGLTILTCKGATAAAADDATFLLQTRQSTAYGRARQLIARNQLRFAGKRGAGGNGAVVQCAGQVLIKQVVACDATSRALSWEPVSPRRLGF